MTDIEEIKEIETIIEGTTKVALDVVGAPPSANMLAKAVYFEGYRKQSEGEWIEHIEKPSWLEDDVEVYYNCSVCGTSHWSITPPFCPNCGAHMKGGAE